MTDTLARPDLPSHAIGRERLARRMSRGATFLGSEIAIMGGAMSWVSERNLVSAGSNAGGFGVIACGAMTPELALQKKLVGVVVDALVIEGMEAGGHIGPVSTSVLAQEMLPVIADQLPVFVAGGIGRGEAIAGYLDMGAAGVQLGTRFVCATESIAHPRFKQAFIRASARDAVASVQIDPRLPVIPVRALKNAGGELFTAKQREVAQSLDEGQLAMAEAQLQIEHYWAGALRRAVVDGDIEHGSVMAGQSVGMVTREEPVTAIIAELMDEAAHALDRRAV